MRRQAVEGGTASEPLLRVDPFALPVRYAVPQALPAHSSFHSGGGAGPRASTRGVGGGAAGVPGPVTAVHLTREMAVLQRRTPAGTTTLSVPLTAYRGVAVRMAAAGEGLRVVLELAHPDPALAVPLAIADDPAEMAADWQAWGRVLGLPLLLVGIDGRIEHPLDQLGPLTVAAPRPRRRHSFFAGRRPRFLVRRKPGRSGPDVRVEGREISAWD